MVPEVGFPPIPPEISSCEAVRLASFLLLLVVRFVALLSVTLTAQVYAALCLSSVLMSMVTMQGVVSADRLCAAFESTREPQRERLKFRSNDSILYF